MPCRERRMAAQLNFGGRSEPAEVEVGSAAVARHSEGRLAEVVLGRNRLHQAVVEPPFERHDRRGIPGQRLVGEGVDLKEWDTGQLARSVISWGSSVSRSVWPSGSMWIRISV